MTSKLGTCNRARCADNSHKEEVDLAGSPHQGVQEKTGQRKVCHEMKTNVPKKTQSRANEQSTYFPVPPRMC